MRNVLFLLCTLLFSGCGIVGNYHKEFSDEQEHVSNAESSRHKLYKDRFDVYRDGAKQDLAEEKQSLEDRKTLTSNHYSLPSTQNISQLSPNVKRQYENRKLRVKANDLIDNDNTASLWGGQDPDSFLFTRTNFKKLGDIIQIKVAKNLKDDISIELNRRFPAVPKEENEEEKKDGDKKDEPKPEVAASSNESGGDPTKVFDQISGLVVEEINKDHLLVRGRKDLLFRNRKRLVEVQALVNKKDITDDDSIISSKILESTITVIR